LERQPGDGRLRALLRRDRRNHRARAVLVRQKTGEQRGVRWQGPVRIGGRAVKQMRPPGNRASSTLALVAVDGEVVRAYRP
jgi:hypothetical protein